MEEMLRLAASGASYKDIDNHVQDRMNSTSSPNIGKWVKRWVNQSPDRPQTLFARALDAYSPASSPEKTSMDMVRRLLAQHRSQCECGRKKEHPDDPVCLECARMERSKAIRV